MKFDIARLCLLSAPLMLASGPALAEAREDKADVVVTNEMEFHDDAVWKHSFDAYKAENGAVNASLRRALSFAEKMEEHGVPADRVKVAVVVHGPSVFDVASSARYGEKYEGEENPNIEIVAKLIERGAEIWVCGFAAKHHGVGNADLLDGVRMAPTGTVAHAELQRRGFVINPYLPGMKDGSDGI